MKTLTIGQKISAGFAALVAITVLLGGVAAWQMKSASAGAHRLSDEYALEVEICSDLQVALAKAMLGVRTFSYTGEKKYLNETNEHLAAAAKQIQLAKDLVAAQPGLVKLAKDIVTIEKDFADYRQLVEADAAIESRFAETENRMNAAAETFSKQIEAFQTAQERALQADLEAGVAKEKLAERALKLQLGAATAGRMSDVRIAVWKAKSERQMKIAEDALARFEAINAGLKKLAPITVREEDKRALAAVEAAAADYEKQVRSMIAIWAERSVVMTKRAGIGDRLVATTGDLVDVGLDITTDVAAEASKNLDRSTVAMVAGLGVALALAVGLAWVIVRDITKALTTVSVRASRRRRSRSRAPRWRSCAR